MSPNPNSFDKGEAENSYINVAYLAQVDETQQTKGYKIACNKHASKVNFLVYLQVGKHISAIQTGILRLFA
jgi:hypothetical protein